MSQEEFCSRGCRSINCFGVIVKSKVDNTKFVHKYLFFQESQFCNVSWKLVQSQLHHILSIHWDNTKYKHLYLRSDRCSAQNLNFYMVSWCGIICLNFGIKSVEICTGPAGHNKFEVDGLFGVLQRLINSSCVRTVKGLAN